MEHYKTTHQCKPVSQLAPLPALTWFQRHGHQALIFAQAQQLKEEELRFLFAREENHRTDEQSYLIEQSTTLSPFVQPTPRHQGVTSYLPEKLSTLPFFEQLTSRHNPKEGLYYPNPAFIPGEQDARYYAIIDGVKSFVLPQLSEHEGKTDSLYKGELKEKMDTHAPFLAQLTVADNETSPFVQLLFSQAEQPWFGAWDINPAIFIRTTQKFDTLAYHLRKFIHLYNEQTGKWYFFRFYDPLILVAYLRYIAHSPDKLASFFGIRDGQAMIASLAARIGNRFYTFCLDALPESTQPVAVSFDEEFEAFLMDYDKHQLLEKLQKEIIPQEFGNNKISPPEIETYFHKALELGFKIEGSIINIVKSLCYLSGNLNALKAHSLSLKNEYGHNLTEVELAELLYEQLKNTHNA
ncbi:DUF4123 domain-containing protein [Aggregatibacter actinomycetemcomitans]|nr:DUF4123 domain-containing protein [Aggregatibacter actinomycetemcomitans]QEH50186.1 DUF4123 domain-containing protein [Aggregatibacter actinomycetemcomitans]